jgi:hypothetical protein
MGALGHRLAAAIVLSSIAARLPPTVEVAQAVVPVARWCRGPQVDQRQAVPRLVLRPAQRRPRAKPGIFQRPVAMLIAAHPGTAPAKSLRAQVTPRLGTLSSNSSVAALPSLQHPSGTFLNTCGVSQGCVAHPFAKQCLLARRPPECVLSAS